MIKGQAQILEYFFLTFFVLMVIVLVGLFLMTYQSMTSSSLQSEYETQDTMFMLKTFSNFPILNKRGYKEGSMFEDSKLTAVSCGELQEVFGTGWFAEVRIPSASETECDASNYPACNKWTFCEEDGDFQAFEVPVNVFRKTTKVVSIGVLTVGFYE